MLAFFEASGVKALQEVRRDHVDAYLAYLGGEYRTAKDTPITTSTFCSITSAPRTSSPGWRGREGSSPRRMEYVTGQSVPMHRRGRRRCSPPRRR